jgi:hypothetical protein
MEAAVCIITDTKTLEIKSQTNFFPVLPTEVQRPLHDSPVPTVPTWLCLLHVQIHHTSMSYRGSHMHLCLLGGLPDSGWFLVDHIMLENGLHAATDSRTKQRRKFQLLYLNTLFPWLTTRRQLSTWATHDVTTHKTSLIKLELSWYHQMWNWELSYYPRSELRIW